MLSNPEFLAEGSAISDLLSPDRILIGGEKSEDGARAMETLASIYEHWIDRDGLTHLEASVFINFLQGF